MLVRVALDCSVRGGVFVRFRKRKTRYSYAELALTAGAGVEHAGMRAVADRIQQSNRHRCHTMKTLIIEEQLREGIGRLAHEIAQHYGDRYRNLPYLAALDPEELARESAR